MKRLLILVALATAFPAFRGFSQPTRPDDGSLPVTVGATVAVIASDPTALVGTSTAAFTFIRTGPTNADLVVPFTYAGTALLGTDFDESGSLALSLPVRKIVIPKGFYAADLVIQPKLNSKARGNKTLDLVLGVLDPLLAVVDNAHTTAEVRLVDDTYNDNPPAVSIVSPKEGESFTLPATVLIQADLGAAAATIQKVSFYADDTFLGSAVAAPFSISWENPNVGSHDLFARAVDASGKSALSQPVHITVTGTPATVAITSPADRMTFDPGTNLLVKVDATGFGDLTVQLFYDTTHEIGELKGPPYEFTWSDLPIGKHTLTAQVEDSAGQFASTSIQVLAADLPPDAEIVSPASGTSFNEGSDITLVTKATDPDDEIRDVTLWVNHRVLGKATVSATDPSLYEFKWLGVKANLYLVQAVVTNSNGTKSTSDAVYLSVVRK